MHGQSNATNAGEDSAASQTLGEYLRTVRMAQKDEYGKRLSMAAISRRSGLALPILSKIEAGKTKNLFASTFVLLIEGYGVAYEDIAPYLQKQRQISRKGKNQ